MKIAICENQVIQINLLNNKIKKWSEEKGVKVTIDNFKSAETFLFKWEDYEKYDIIFLDIKLSQMSGIELSNVIREKNKSVKIVFVTGMVKYALHGYKVGALHYLMKPINTDDLYFCLDKTQEEISINPNWVTGFNNELLDETQQLTITYEGCMAIYSVTVNDVAIGINVEK